MDEFAKNRFEELGLDMSEEATNTLKCFEVNEKGLYIPTRKTINDLFTNEEKGKELKAISYSFGTSFFTKIIQKFDYVEILCGNEELITNAMRKSQLADLVQIGHGKVFAKTINEEIILKMVEEERLKLYIPKQVINHSKLYLMNFNDVNYRVYSGSANMSGMAHSLSQEEIRIISNIKENYETMLKYYEEEKEENFERLTPEIFISLKKDKNYLDKNPKKIPIYDNITIDHPVVVNLDKIDKEKINYTYNCVEEVIKELDEIQEKMPKPKKTKDTMQVLLTEDYKKEACNKIEGRYNKSLEIEEKSKFPMLKINYNDYSISFDDNKIEKEEDFDKIRNDFECIKKFMYGIDNYAKEINRNKIIASEQEMMKLLIWSFISPFIAYIRYLSKKFNIQYTSAYPKFAFLFGEASNGKTQFTLLLSKLISGKWINLIDKEKFTNDEISKYKMCGSSMPLVFDELKKSTKISEKLESITKDDLFGINTIVNDHNYPPIIFSMNQKCKLKPEHIKRIMGAYTKFNAIDTSKVAIDNFNIESIIKEDVGNSLFLYVAYNYILPKLKEFTEKEERDEKITLNEFDFYKICYDGLAETYKKVYETEELPIYFKKISYLDILNKDENELQAKKTLYKWLDICQQYFQIKKDTIIIADEKNPEAIIKFEKQLPDYIEREYMGGGFMVNKAELEEFLGIELYQDFGIFGKVKYRKKEK